MSLSKSCTRWKRSRPRGIASDRSGLLHACLDPGSQMLQDPFASLRAMSLHLNVFLSVMRFGQTKVVFRATLYFKARSTRGSNNSQKRKSTLLILGPAKGFALMRAIDTARAERPPPSLLRSMFQPLCEVAWIISSRRVLKDISRCRWTWKASSAVEKHRFLVQVSSHSSILSFCPIRYLITSSMHRPVPYDQFKFRHQHMLCTRSIQSYCRGTRSLFQVR